MVFGTNKQKLMKFGVTLYAWYYTHPRGGRAPGGRDEETSCDDELFSRVLLGGYGMMMLSMEVNKWPETNQTCRMIVMRGHG